MIEAIILDFGGVVFRNKEERDDQKNIDGAKAVGMNAAFFTGVAGLRTLFEDNQLL